MTRISAFMLAALLLLLNCTVSQKSVGIAFSSRPDVLNSVGLRENWNSLLRIRGDSAVINPVVIKQSMDEDTGKCYYFLFAQSPDMKLKMAQLLYREKRDFFIDRKQPEIVICDCEDYSPKRVNGAWVCYSVEGGNECEIEVASERKQIHDVDSVFAGR